MFQMAKEIRINVRTTSEIKCDFEVAAKQRGLTVSSLVNSMAVKIIREEKERDSKGFEEMKQRLLLQEKQKKAAVSGSKKKGITEEPNISPQQPYKEEEDRGILDDEKQPKKGKRKTN
ncbi:MAG TPA: hypothetical protein VGD05_06240 [Pyrinomonadaceae bacterium]|jgi:hypothetical protein